jgi:hypothetical protein
MLSQAVANLIFACALCVPFSLASAAGADPAAPPPATNSAGRILVVEHPDATRSFTPQAAPVGRMLREGLLRLSGTDSLRQAWLHFVSTQDIIGIKIHSSPGRMSGTRPVVVSALIESLLEAGLRPQQIVLWDRRLSDLRLAGYFELAEQYRIQIAGALDEGYDAETSYSSTILGRLVFGDLEFNKKTDGVGRNSYVSKLVTKRLTKIINVAPLLNHNQAGVSGLLYTLTMAGIDNILRFDEPDRLAIAVPEIYALPEFSDRVVLNLVDALICQYRGEEFTRFNYATPLNQLWFGRDPVALDALALQELDRHRGAEQKSHKASLQIYSNAEIMDLGIANTNRQRIERLELN